MATRKTGSRRLLVDGIAYRYRIRHRATFAQTDYSGTLHLTVELAEQPGSVVVLDTDRPHPADCIPRPVIPVRPSDVAGWIRQALQAGWNPENPGPQLHARVSGSSLLLLA
jgi:hypothetical protein